MQQNSITYLLSVVDVVVVVDVLENEYGSLIEINPATEIREFFIFF